MIHTGRNRGGLEQGLRHEEVRWITANKKKKHGARPKKLSKEQEEKLRADYLKRTGRTELKP